MNDSFKIIGADGREYGPVTLDELRAWVSDSRVARQTLVRRLSEDQWSRADSIEELADLLTTMPELPEAGGGEALRAAGFWIRFAAHWPDQFLIAAAVIACIGLPGTPGTEPKFAELVAWTQRAQPWILLFSGFYYILTTWIWGATLGKFIFGLRVVCTDDSAVGLARCTLRFLGSVVSTIFGLGYLFIAFRADKRALHDLFAGTRVVFKPR